MKSFHTLGTLAVTVFGVTGAVILWFYFSPSTDPHDYSISRFAFRIWIVAAAAFWTWYLREERKRAHPTNFTEAVEFVEHLELRATFDEGANLASTWLAPGNAATAVLAVGGTGFNARLRRIPEAAPPVTGTSPTADLRLAVQLLVPKTALASLPVGATPRVLIDGGPVGVGEVVRHLIIAKF